MKIIVTPQEIVNSNLWRLFPTINCDKSKDIPCDYPGAMGVPITFLDKMGKNDGHSGFELIDDVKPKIGERLVYHRLIIRNLKPQLPDEVDLVDLLNTYGVDFELGICRNREKELTGASLT